MKLSKLQTIYNWIDNLNPNIKTIIIIILSVLVIEVCFSNHTKAVIDDYSEKQHHDKQLAEKYTETITPYIINYCDRILLQDKEASNVILLNYHNTLTSSNGLSYRYLTAIAERRRGFNTKNCIRIWQELDYINYGEELNKINQNNYLRIDSTDLYQKTLPNLVELLKLSNAHSAAFYSIRGVDNYVGMIVVLYPNHKFYHLGYYPTVITPSAQPLAILLDYNSMREKFKDLYQQNKTDLHNLLN